MSIQGIVEGGVVVLANGCTIADGTAVAVFPLTGHHLEGEPMQLNFTVDSDMPIAERMRKLAEWCETLPTDLPSDLSANHDHYLHGTAKRQ
jgi:hypothetical protein